MSRGFWALLVVGAQACFAGRALQEQPSMPVGGPAPGAYTATDAASDTYTATEAGAGAETASETETVTETEAEIETETETEAEIETETEVDDGDEGIALDGVDESDVGELPPAAARAPHPFDALTDAELETMLLQDAASLGAMSLGRPDAGALVGGQPMPDGEQWIVVNPRETWGTPETVAYLKACIGRVNQQFPGTPPLPIGDISDADGGHLLPHLSHQSGRDVDIGYYYTTGDKWYTKVTTANLDFARTWAFVEAIATETDVEVMFMDRAVQKMLREYAAGAGESEAWLDALFGGPSSPLRPLIRHEPGHRTHIHIRFYNPVAQESGRRLYPLLLAHKRIEPPTYYIRYKVKRGDTLKRIARKFGTTVKAVQRANGLRSTRIIANRSYKIPRRGGVQTAAALVVPQRRRPPAVGAGSSGAAAAGGE